MTEQMQKNIDRMVAHGKELVDQNAGAVHFVHYTKWCKIYTGNDYNSEDYGAFGGTNGRKIESRKGGAARV